MGDESIYCDMDETECAERGMGQGMTERGAIVVYELVAQLMCCAGTKSIAVSAPNSTTPLTVNPGSGGGLSAGDSTRSSTTALLSALAFALFCTLL